MIYRILVDFRLNIGRPPRFEANSPDAPPEIDPDEGRLVGASFGAMASVMDARRLRKPRISNGRTRFFFTETGWHQVGRHIAAEARRLGHVVQVIRRKNPAKSRIVFKDGLQLALLPNRARFGRAALVGMRADTRIPT